MKKRIRYNFQKNIEFLEFKIKIFNFEQFKNLK